MKEKQDIKNLTVSALERFLVSLGQKSVHAKAIFTALHIDGITDAGLIADVPTSVRKALLDSDCMISTLKIVEKLTDTDGTVKYLFATSGGFKFEAVLLGTTDKTVNRYTVCVSSQSGCKMGCTFCATSQIPMDYNLSAAEICEQINLIARDTKQCGAKGVVNNVVYMGMGEPMDNYTNVITSINMLHHHSGHHIAPKHLTLSTCGVIAGIDQYASEPLQVNLAVSLHGSDNMTRKEMMPITRKYPLIDLIAAVKGYQDSTGKRVMFQYLMLSGVNDAIEDAHRVVHLLADMNAIVNLIEYNPHDSASFAPSSLETIVIFRDILMKANIETTVRYTRGLGVKGACGQLGADWQQRDLRYKSI